MRGCEDKSSSRFRFVLVRKIPTTMTSTCRRMVTDRTNQPTNNQTNNQNQPLSTKCLGPSVEGPLSTGIQGRIRLPLFEFIHGAAARWAFSWSCFLTSRMYQFYCGYVAVYAQPASLESARGFPSTFLGRGCRIWLLFFPKCRQESSK
jgi:hypothetical protein